MVYEIRSGNFLRCVITADYHDNFFLTMPITGRSCFLGLVMTSKKYAINIKVKTRVKKIKLTIILMMNF